jgi:hypothetical protein
MTLVLWSIALVLAATLITAYFGYVYLVVVRAGRSRPVVPGAPTPELRGEPPAVVNLLVNRMTSAPQAASATLLDLAARRILEIVDVADGGEHSLVRIRNLAPPDLTPYERRVLDRIRHGGGDQGVAVGELAQRHADGSHRWHDFLVREAIHDARRRGLIQQNERLTVAAGVVAAALAWLILSAPLLLVGESARKLLVFALCGLPFAAVFGGVLLSVMASVMWSEPDRYTAEGRRAVAHWLGVAAWLRAHEPLRDLPPAAVAVWDRYLAYGVALDAMPHAVRALDFESAGHRDVLWSAHAGHWRTVNVKYRRRNRLLRPIGPVGAGFRRYWSAAMLLCWVIIGGLILAAGSAPTVLRYPLLTFAGLQVVRQVYWLVRSIVEVSWPMRITGTLLDISQASRSKTDSYGRQLGITQDLPTFYYFVVDDGSTDILRPWIVTRNQARGAGRIQASLFGLAGTGPFGPDGAGAFVEEISRVAFRPGDQVHLEGERWTRYARLVQPAFPSGPIATPIAPPADVRGLGRPVTPGSPDA